MGVGPPLSEKEEKELGLSPAVEEPAKQDYGAQLTMGAAPPTAKPLPLHGSSHLARCALPLGAGPGKGKEEGGTTVGGDIEG